MALLNLGEDARQRSGIVGICPEYCSAYFVLGGFGEIFRLKGSFRPGNSMIHFLNLRCFCVNRQL
jgi:hypothetical protein